MNMDNNKTSEKEFGVEDIEAYEEALAKKARKKDIEDIINEALPSLILDFIILTVVSAPILLVLWLVIKILLFAIGATVFFVCLYIITFYRSLSQKIKWKKVKDIVLPELKRKTAVHFRKIRISVTDNYLVTWSEKNVNVFKLCDVKCISGKKAIQNLHKSEKRDDMLLLKRNRKTPKIVGSSVDYTEIDKVNKFIKERTNT